LKCVHEDIKNFIREATNCVVDLPLVGSSAAAVEAAVSLGKLYSKLVGLQLVTLTLRIRLFHLCDPFSQ